MRGKDSGENKEGAEKDRQVMFLSRTLYRIREFQLPLFLCECVSDVSVFSDSEFYGCVQVRKKREKVSYRLADFLQYHRDRESTSAIFGDIGHWQVGLASFKMDDFDLLTFGHSADLWVAGSDCTTCDNVPLFSPSSSSSASLKSTGGFSITYGSGSGVFSPLF